MGRVCRALATSVAAYTVTRTVATVVATAVGATAVLAAATALATDVFLGRFYSDGATVAACCDYCGIPGTDADSTVFRY